MISNHARDGFNQMLKQGIKGSLLASSEDTCEITISPDLSAVKETKIVILTVSSYLFSVSVLIYFTPDIATKEHFARINKIPASDMSEQAFFDTISECGNICCGTLNRDLGRFFPNIGMSTPNIIDKECSSYLNVLDCGHIQHFKVDINNSVHFHVSLCVCDYADLDFVLDVTEEDTSTGELELF